MNGYRGDTVVLFRPGFRDHAMTAIVGRDQFSGPIEQTGRNKFEFGGRDLRDVLDDAKKIYLVKVVHLVPAYDPDYMLDAEPLDLVDDDIA